MGHNKGGVGEKDIYLINDQTLVAFQKTLGSNLFNIDPIKYGDWRSVKTTAHGTLTVEKMIEAFQSLRKKGKL